MHPIFQQALREAIELRQRALGPRYPHKMAPYFSELANLLHNRDKLGEAELLVRQAFKLRCDDPDQPAPDPTDDIRRSFVLILTTCGRYQEVEPLLMEALQFAREKWGESHDEYAGPIADFGYLLIRRGNDEEGIKALSHAAAIGRKVPAAKKTIWHGVCLSNLGLVLERQNRKEEAEEVLREALKIFRAKDLNHPAMAVPLINLAVLCEHQERLTDLSRTDSYQAAVVRSNSV